MATAQSVHGLDIHAHDKQRPRRLVAAQPIAISSRRLRLRLLGINCCWPLTAPQAHAAVAAVPATPLQAWVWPALMALLLLVMLALAAICLLLLRRERQLQKQLDARPGSPADSMPDGSAAHPQGATAATQAELDNERESFSYTVSHDLRAPIRVVEGFTRILKEDYGRVLDRIGNDHLDRVLGAAARMNGMIDALLTLSQLSNQPLAHQPVNLSQLAGYVADDLRRQWPDRDVNLQIDADMQVLGDPILLRMVVENLLGNAWKYSSKRAQSKISFTCHPRDAQTFTISDNGAGFDMRFADRLFGVFQRLHSASDFQGTGVGLASVRRIVRRHDGEIWAESEIDKGARFHFSIKLR